MKRWLTAALALLVLLGAYVVAGPYMAINGIRTALVEQRAGKLERHVDFPALRVNLRAQLNDHMVRRIGMENQSGLLGSMALTLTSSMVDRGVDTLITPLGINTLLRGRSAWLKVHGETANGDRYGPAPAFEPLQDASHRYESPSRFTSTVTTENGDATVFVFTRNGLRWRLTDIRLPLSGSTSAAVTAAAGI